MNVHVFGMQRITRGVLPDMLVRGQDTIVNVAFSEALRGELEGRGVDVLGFAPGHTDTTSAFPLRVPLMQPAEVARELLRSVLDRRRTCVCGASNRSLLWLKRLSPALADRAVNSPGREAMETLRGRAARG